MNRTSRIVKPFLGIVVIIGGVFLLMAQSNGKIPKLSGITAEDEHPSGCHDEEDTDGLQDVSQLRRCRVRFQYHHPQDTLPESDGIPLRVRLRGECLDCHTLDVENGTMGIRSAPKNWWPATVGRLTDSLS